MPPIRADSLYPFRGIIRHYFIPDIDPAAFIAIGFTVIIAIILVIILIIILLFKTGVIYLYEEEYVVEE